MPASTEKLLLALGDPEVGFERALFAERGSGLPVQSLDPLLELHERDLASGLQDAPWPPVYPKMPNEPPRVAPSRARKEP